MRAMVLTGFCEPLVQMDVPIPPCGPRQVRIRVRACGVCGTDLKIVSGALPDVRPPWIIGHEIAGEVECVGSEVTDIELGSRVTSHVYLTCGTCKSCMTGRDNLCERLIGRLGFDVPGGLAEYVCVPRENVFRVPDSVAFERAAILPDAVSTMFNAITQVAKVAPGATVSIFGVGGLGIHGVQIARLSGSRIIAVDVMPEKLEVARQFGADVMVDFRGGGYPDAVAEFTDGRGVDVVVDCVGTRESVDANLRVLAPGGALVLAGYTPGKSFQVDMLPFHMKELKILAARNAPKHVLAEVIDLASSGRILPVVQATFPLREANEALGAITKLRNPGRVAVLCEEEG